MATWLARRLAGSVLLLLALTSAIFFAVRLAPGDPLDQMAREEMDAGDRQLLRRRLGLEGSLLQQYGRWAQGALVGDFGTSLRQHRPVAQIVGQALPATLLLTVTAYVWQLVLAAAAAAAMVLARSRLLRHAVQTAGLILYSLPAFWFGLVLILVMSRQLGWFPAAGMASTGAADLPPAARLLDLLHHLTLPAAVLALGAFMGTARYLRSSLEEALAQDYVLSARAHGLSNAAILRRHALRNALLPVITLAGLHLPHLIGGAVAVETVFGWPGLGRVTIEAVWARDYPVIMATTFLAAAMVVVGSLLADVCYQIADPRVRAAGRRAAA